MTTVNTFIGKKDKPGHVGLELEVEAKKPLPEVNGIWLSKPEGSLRGHAMEYVTDGPIACDNEKFQKIKLLTDILHNPALRVDHDSPRTSLHVHVNVGQLTPVEMWTAATAYWLCENVLIKYCGQDMREANLFCLRLADAEGVIKMCSKDLADKRPFRYIKSDKIRYSAQNLNAVPKFGSIEYRGMRGTTDPVIIDTWSDELYKMVVSSKKYSDPADLLDKYANLDKKDFLKSLFSDHFVRTLTEIPKWRELMDENVGSLTELGYFHPDWKQYLQRIEKNHLNNKINEKALYSDSDSENPFGYHKPLTKEQAIIAHYDYQLPLTWHAGIGHYFIPSMGDGDSWDSIEQRLDQGVAEPSGQTIMPSHVQQAMNNLQMIDDISLVTTTAFPWQTTTTSSTS